MHQWHMTGPLHETDRQVEVRFPLTAEQEAADREAWAYLAVIDKDGEPTYPTCFRGADEIHLPHQACAGGES